MSVPDLEQIVSMLFCHSANSRLQMPNNRQIRLTVRIASEFGTAGADSPACSLVETTSELRNLNAGRRRRSVLGLRSVSVP